MSDLHLNPEQFVKVTILFKTGGTLRLFNLQIKHVIGWINSGFVLPMTRGGDGRLLVANIWPMDTVQEILVQDANLRMDTGRYAAGGEKTGDRWTPWTPWTEFTDEQLAEISIALDHRLAEADAGNAYVRTDVVRELLNDLPDSPETTETTDTPDHGR